VLKQKNLKDELPGKLAKGWDPKTSPGRGSTRILPCCRQSCRARLEGWREPSCASRA